MASKFETDIAIIGAGSAGLSVAAGAAQLGAGVTLIERDRMGGDCLNVGCVPSKSLLATAKRAAVIRGAGRFGVNGHEPSIEHGLVRAHISGVIATLAPQDSAERFAALGVRVVKAEARFNAPDILKAGPDTITARRYVVATGSRPAIPDIRGLATVPYLTNETIFDLDATPAHLIILGGGPQGVELAQAHRRLGAQVTLVERATILGHDDAEAADVVRSSLRGEGILLCEGVAAAAIRGDGNGIAVELERAPDGAATTLRGSHLLVAAGRSPTVADLGLEAAGIAFDAHGIEVDHSLRTTNRRAYAIGDVVGRLPFTHMAAHHASVVVRNALFRLPAAVEERAIPWVTYTDPELAQIGVTEAEAARRGMRVDVVRWPFAQNDRAQAEHRTQGFIKVVVDRTGRPIGATIVGAEAGELAGMWVLAIKERIKLASIAQMILPYPTMGEAGKRAAGAYFAPTLFGPRTRRLIRLLRHLP